LDGDPRPRTVPSPGAPRSYFCPSDQIRLEKLSTCSPPAIALSWPPYPPGLSAAGAPASHTQTPAPWSCPSSFLSAETSWPEPQGSGPVKSVPQDLCPTRPPWDPSPLAAELGPAPEGQGSKLEVEGGLGNGQQLLPLGPPPHGSGYGTGSYQDPGMKLCLVAQPGTLQSRLAQFSGAGSCAAPQTRFLLEHLCNHRAWGGGGS
jgi:hypothetical protein